MSMAHADPASSILALGHRLGAMRDREHLLDLVDPPASRVSKQA